jgi:tetratricopeptide (TPR) repeat protein
MGYVDDALSLLETVHGAEIYLARALLEVAVATYARGDDPALALQKLESLARNTAGNRYIAAALAELAVANLRVGRNAGAYQIRDELVTGTAGSEANRVIGLVAIATALADTNVSDAERLFELVLRHDLTLAFGAHDVRIMIQIACAQVDAELFSAASDTIQRIDSPSTRAYVERHVALHRAAHGDLDEAVEMLDFRNDIQKPGLAQIASTLLAQDDWQRAKPLLTALLSGTEDADSTSRSWREQNLARIAVVLARQKTQEDARLALTSIRDAKIKADAMCDLAKAYAEAGDFQTAEELIGEIDPNRSYVREEALKAVGLERARWGDLRSVPKWEPPDQSEDDIVWEPIGNPNDPIETLIFLREHNSLGLIEEFASFSAQMREGRRNDNSDPRSVQSSRTRNN